MHQGGLSTSTNRPWCTAGERGSDKDKAVAAATARLFVAGLDCSEARAAPSPVQLALAHSLCQHYVSVQRGASQVEAARRPLQTQRERLASEEAALRARLAEVSALRCDLDRSIGGFTRKAAAAAVETEAMVRDARRLSLRRTPQAYLSALGKCGLADAWKDLVLGTQGRRLYASALYQQMQLHVATSAPVAPAPKVPAKLQQPQQAAAQPKAAPAVVPTPAVPAPLEPAALPAAPAEAYPEGTDFSDLAYNPLLYTAQQLGMTEEQHAEYIASWAAYGLDASAIESAHKGDAAAVAHVNATFQNYMAIQGYASMEGMAPECAEQYNAYMAVQGWTYLTPEGHTVQVNADGMHTYVEPYSLPADETSQETTSGGVPEVTPVDTAASDWAHVVAALPVPVYDHRDMATLQSEIMASLRSRELHATPGLSHPPAVAAGP